jgi:hypothetical protein
MPIVTVSADPQLALDKPEFIIKFTDPGTGAHTYYLTRAVWAYDLATAAVAEDDDKIDGCQAIALEFSGATPAQAVEAIKRNTPPGDSPPGTQTDPG